MTSPTFSHISLSSLFILLLLLLLPLLSSALNPASDRLRLSSPAFSAKRQAEKFIRALNLFPKDDINTLPHRPLLDAESDAGAKIVEKQFQMPFLDAALGPSVKELGHHAGYYRLPRSNAASMFYLFFESRTNKNNPVVIWLTGGPGCSSELALFYENGPFRIQKNLSLTWNDYGWDKASNILFVDQPVGTGFSYTTNTADIRHDEEGVSNDLYDFLQEFFTQHPQFAKNDFYITGESYAGHYVPALASRVHKGNKAKEGTHINLKGFAIGNGLTNPEIQYKAYSDYALEMKLITKPDYDSISQIIPDCEESAKACAASTSGDACENSLSICNSIVNQIMQIISDTNHYDIRKKCEGSLCYDFSNMETFLNKQPVRDALGVGDIEFVSCSTTVYDAMQNDWMRNLEVGIPALLEDGIKLLVYAGEYDFICNWLGNSKWVHAMEWSGQKAFGAAQTVPFKVAGAEAGLLKSHGPLAFLKVHDAGHMVPMDQPEAALQMLTNWMQGNMAVAKSGERVAPTDTLRS
ncbi:hypothetical protein COP1_006532 [Malus domestica]